ncbi:hypothetical protein DFP72DRAFT_856555 [Ephemerocybe angulata]|uniref:Uncharacterized protein n=1 Tax=Ephemerocybe angulata TaxID=980116 RepID=A0A8H6HEE0_9AGAR|nr:hypothetical protein DFP72DRAFT_856555 [Tulosesus angulatus]
MPGSQSNCEFTEKKKENGLSWPTGHASSPGVYRQVFTFLVGVVMRGGSAEAGSLSSSSALNQASIFGVGVTIPGNEPAVFSYSFRALPSNWRPSRNVLSNERLQSAWTKCGPASPEWQHFHKPAWKLCEVQAGTRLAIAGNAESRGGFLWKGYGYPEAAIELAWPWELTRRVPEVWVCLPDYGLAGDSPSVRNWL